MYYSDKPIILFQAWLPFSVVFVSAGGLSCGGMVSDTVPLSVCFMCSISMSEQFSELDRAESIDVTVMSTALSLVFVESRGFSTAGLSSASSSRVGGTKLLLLMSSMALRNCYEVIGYKMIIFKDIK